MCSSLSQMTSKPIVRSHRDGVRSAALKVVVSGVTGQHEGKPPVIMHRASWMVTAALHLTGINASCCIFMSVRVFYLVDETHLKSVACFSVFTTYFLLVNSGAWSQLRYMFHIRPQVIISQWADLSDTQNSLEWKMLCLHVTLVCRPISSHIVQEAKDPFEPLKHPSRLHCLTNQICFTDPRVSHLFGYAQMKDWDWWCRRLMSCANFLSVCLSLKL